MARLLLQLLKLKEMKKVVATAFLFTIFLGCEVIDGGGTCSDVPPFFDINDLSLSNRIFESSCCSEEITPNQRIEFDRYAIVGSYDFTLHSHIPTKGGFFSRSYALSCIAGGHEGSLETISDFVVITQFDFNESYLAGDTINNLITYNDFFTERTLTELLNGEDRSIPSPQFFLQLTEQPSATDTASFSITITLDNGESYSKATPNVVFE